MPKQSINDITPPGNQSGSNPKRTIRDIPVPNHRRLTREIEVEEETPPPPRISKKEMRGSRRRFPRLIYIVVGVFVLGLLALLGSRYLSESAVVTVTEKQKLVSADDTFIAKRQAKEGEMPFETVTASKEDSKTVPATGEKQVENRASGTIVIYNNYSTASQRLIKNTRFETSDGRVYRIDQSIVVPGKDKNTGTPGSIEAIVYADAAGPDYNIGLSDFTIPGFKGDPRFSKFYARSKTAMTGGFIGKIKTASSADLLKARGDLETALRTDLTKNIESQVPVGYVLFRNAVYVDFQLTSPQDSNEIHEKATAYGIIFSSKVISQNIAKATLGLDYKGEDIIGDNLSALAFMPIPADARPWETGVVSFSLKGTTTLTWLFDQEKLKQDLAGQQKNKSRIAEILGAYQGSIDYAEVVVRPFWKNTLPSNPNAISIKIVAGGKAGSSK